MAHKKSKPSINSKAFNAYFSVLRSIRLATKVSPSAVKAYNRLQVRS